MWLFEPDLYFFYITNDRETPASEIVFLANDRCHQENLITQLKGGICGLSMPVDDLVSNWAYMVMASLTWSLKAWNALLLPEGGLWSRLGRRRGRCCGWNLLRSVRRSTRCPARWFGACFAYHAVAGLEPMAGGFPLPGGAVARSPTVLRRSFLKSASGCPDPCRRRTKERRMPMRERGRGGRNRVATARVGLGCAARRLRFDNEPFALRKFRDWWHPKMATSATRPRLRAWPLSRADGDEGRNGFASRPARR
jgi:hypothetical protein